PIVGAREGSSGVVRSAVEARVPRAASASVGRRGEQQGVLLEGDAEPVSLVRGTLDGLPALDARSIRTGLARRALLARCARGPLGARGAARKGRGTVRRVLARRHSRGRGRTRA